MTADKIKVRDLAPTAVRLTPEMRHALAREAAINGRSLHGEIVHRLKESMTDSGNSAPLLANEPNAVPLAPDQEMVDAVRAAGGNPRFTVYPDVGHNAWDPAYADPQLVEWLLAQHRPRGVASTRRP